MSGAHLTVQNLTTGYHGFQVLQDLALEAAPGITVIVCPNGAGKTTLLKALAGLLPRQGTVTLDGQAVPAMNATACVRLAVRSRRQGDRERASFWLAQVLVHLSPARRVAPR